MRALLCLGTLLVATATPSILLADTFVLPASKDNTLYDNTSYPLSNGAGSYFFAGQTISSSFSLRRGLIAFDVAAAVPAGSVITDATLT